MTRLRDFYRRFSPFRLFREVAEIRKRVDDTHRLVSQATHSIETIRRRQTLYLGNGDALTFLRDDTPIYVNAHDIGGPASLMADGEIEAECFDVVRSFLTPTTVFADIGANVGYYTIRVATLTRPGGRVFAFEPHPHLVYLLHRTCSTNGVLDRVRLHGIGLSDTAGRRPFAFPHGHLGGGQIEGAHDGPADIIEADVRRFDDVFPPDLTLDFAKIDVEKHEAAVLTGMASTIARSARAKILFEKFEPDSPSNAFFETFFRDRGMTLFAIDSASQLRAVDRLVGLSGYFLAMRVDDPAMPLDRRFFDIHPDQLFFAPSVRRTPLGDAVEIATDAAGPLCHGPYWPLRSGTHRVTFEGAFDQPVTVHVADRGGLIHHSFVVAGPSPRVQFWTPHDLVNFELILRAPAKTTVRLGPIRVRRLP